MIPIDEQPYPLPVGWQWCRLGDACNYGHHETVQPSAMKVGKLLIDLEDIEKGSGNLIGRKVFDGTNANSSKHFFQRGNILYGKLRPYLNKVIIADEDGYCSSEILPLDFGEKVLNRYAHFFLLSPDFVQYANQNSYGTNMPRLGTRAGRQAPLPAPAPRRTAAHRFLARRIIFKARRGEGSGSSGRRQLETAAGGYPSQSFFRRTLTVMARRTRHHSRQLAEKIFVGYTHSFKAKDD